MVNERVFLYTIIMLTTYVTYTLAALTIGAELIALAAIAALIRKWKTGTLCVVGKKLSTYAIPLSTLMAASAMAGSLYYSEIAHYVPCLLCWYQRIAMYPLVVIGFFAGIANKKWSPEMLTLSLVGAIIAFYHYLLQIGVVVSTRCADVGYSVSCADKFAMTYGYITIPMMALSVFVAIIALQLLGRSSTEAPAQTA